MVKRFMLLITILCVVTFCTTLCALPAEPSEKGSSKIPTLQELTSRAVAPQIVAALLSDSDRCDLSRPNCIDLVIKNNINENIIDPDYVLNEMKLQLGMPEYSVQIGDIHASAPNLFTFDSHSKKIYTVQPGRPWLASHNLRPGSKPSACHYSMPYKGTTSWNGFAINTQTKDLFFTNPKNLLIFNVRDEDCLTIAKDLYPEKSDSYCPIGHATPILVNENNHTLFVSAEEGGYTNKPNKIYIFRRDAAGQYKRVQIITAPTQSYFTNVTLNHYYDELCVVSADRSVSTWRNSGGSYVLQPPRFPDQVVALACMNNPSQIVAIMNDPEKPLYMKICILERDVDGKYQVQKVLVEDEPLGDKPIFFFNPISNILMMRYAFDSGKTLLVLDVVTGSYHLAFNTISIRSTDVTNLAAGRIAHLVPHPRISGQSILNICSPRARDCVLATTQNADKYRLPQLMLLNAIQMQAQSRTKIVIHHAHQQDFLAIIPLLAQRTLEKCYLMRVPIKQQDRYIHESGFAPSLWYNTDEESVPEVIHRLLDYDLKQPTLMSELSYQYDIVNEKNAVRNYLKLLVYPEEFDISVHEKEHMLFEPQGIDIQDNFLPSASYAFDPCAKKMFKLSENSIFFWDTTHLFQPSKCRRIYQEQEAIRHYLLHYNKQNNLLVLLGRTETEHCLTLLQQNFSGQCNALQRMSIQKNNLIDASFNSDTNELLVVHKLADNLNNISIFSYNYRTRRYEHAHSLAVESEEKIICKAVGDYLFVARHTASDDELVSIYKRKSFADRYCVCSTLELAACRGRMHRLNSVISLSYNNRLNILGIRRDKSVELWRGFNDEGEFLLDATYPLTKFYPKICVLLNLKTGQFFYEDREKPITTTHWHDYVNEATLLKRSSLQQAFMFGYENLFWDTEVAQGPMQLKDYTCLQLALLANIIKQGSIKHDYPAPPIMIHEHYRKDVEVIKKHVDESVLRRIQFC